MDMMTKDPNAIRKAGIESLTKALGPVGMAYFLRMYEMGEGDYTKERHELLKDVTLDEIKRSLE